MKKIALILLCLNVFETKAQKLADVSLELLDGNIIKGATLFNEIELLTAYGKLTIPVAKVNHIDIGISKDNAITEKAKTNLKILATGSNEELMKVAFADLVKLGIKAIPAITDFQEDPKNNTIENSYSGEFTIDNALSEIKNAANIGEDFPKEDIITFENNYTMGGSYSFNKLEIKTEYGNLSIPKEKIKSIDISLAADSEKGEYSFKLSASKNISGNANGGWLKTGIKLKAGQRFNLIANGEVTLASLSNNKYKADGSIKAAGATEFTKPYSSGEGEYSGLGYPTYGQVVYKIGETSTETIQAGDKLNTTAKSSGMLMISIYETVYNQNNKGAYTVKITIGK